MRKDTMYTHVLFLCLCATTWVDVGEACACAKKVSISQILVNMHVCMNGCVHMHVGEGAGFIDDDKAKEIREAFLEQITPLVRQLCKCKRVCFACLHCYVCLKYHAKEIACTVMYAWCVVAYCFENHECNEYPSTHQANSGIGTCMQ